MALASAIYGFYSSTVYLTPIFGGLLADCVLGTTRTIILGACLMALGHFLMAFDQLVPDRAGLPDAGRGLFQGQYRDPGRRRSIRPATIAAPTPSRSTTSASTPA